MDAVAEIREGIRWGNEILEMVMADVTDEHARHIPAGTANPIGALYAHGLLAEDGIVNGLLKGGAPRFAAQPDSVGVAAPQMNLDPQWARGLKPNLGQLRAYKDSIIADVEAYLDTLTSVDLDRAIDLSFAGLGHRRLGWVLSALVAGHLNNMAGEISALKGILGLRGYPF
jgi:hypothetical protein